MSLWRLRAAAPWLKRTCVGGLILGSVLGAGCVKTAPPTEPVARASSDGLLAESEVEADGFERYLYLLLSYDAEERQRAALAPFSEDAGRSARPDESEATVVAYLPVVDGKQPAGSRAAASAGPLQSYDFATSQHLQEALGLAGTGPFLVVTMKPAVSLLREQRKQFYTPELLAMSDQDEFAAYRQYTLEVSTRSRRNVDAILDLSAVSAGELKPFVASYLRKLRAVPSWAGQIAGGAAMMARDVCAELGGKLAASPESESHVVRIQPAIAP